jgi:integrase
MTEQAISPLRRRMIEDMAIRKLGAKTQHDYVQRVKDFAVFLGRSPGKASKEDVRRFQLHLSESGAHTPKINATVSALRFFFDVTLDRADLGRQMTFIYEPRKVPVVLSPDEVRRFVEAAPGLKYKAALSVAYGAGLRVSEVAALRTRPRITESIEVTSHHNAPPFDGSRRAVIPGRTLKVADIDSKRTVIRVEQGKGRKDRNAMLSPVLLELLRAWWKVCLSRGWLFPGRDPAQPITTRQLTRACHLAAQLA